jgi:selenocysteine-specific translation elongation factor
MKNVSKTQDIIKWTNVQIVGISEKKGKGIENIPNEIAENFSNLGKITK